MKLLITCFFLVCFTSLSAQYVVKWDVQKLQDFIATKQDKVLIINFWATYCLPCLQEIPGLVKVSKEVKDVAEVRFVSIDPKDSFPSAIRKFAVKQNITSPMIWLNVKPTTYFFPKISNQWKGAIPSTLFINYETGYRKVVEGKMSEEEFLKEIMKAKSDLPVKD